MPWRRIVPHWRLIARRRIVTRWSLWPVNSLPSRRTITWGAGFIRRSPQRRSLAFVSFRSHGNLSWWYTLGPRWTLNWRSSVRITLRLAVCLSWRQFARRSNRPPDGAGGACFNRTGAGSCDRKLGTSDDTFASIQHARATQFVIKRNAGRSIARAGWPFSQVTRRCNSLRTGHGNAFRSFT